MNGQSKKESFIEVTTDTILGFIISVVSYLMILPMFGLNVSVSGSLWLTVYFVTISYIRRYFTRRWFNANNRKS